MIEPKDTIAFMYLRLIHEDDYRLINEERWKHYIQKGVYVLMYESPKIKIMCIRNL